MNHRTKGRRFLLKVTGLAAGAAAVACSSTTSAPGSIAIPVDGGIVANPPDGGDDGGNPCGNIVCGSVADGGGGIVANPPDGGDGGDAEVVACEDASCGLVGNPVDGGDASDQ